MKIMETLISNDLKITLSTFGLYIGYFIFCAIAGFLCWLSPSSTNFFINGQATMIQVFVVVNWMQFFMIPILTMKSVAAEKRNETIDLLFSVHVTSHEFITAKFISLTLVSIIPLCFTIPYYISISFLGHVDHGVVMMGYMALIFTAMLYVSVGIFASSLTKSAISALFISLGILVLFQHLFVFLSAVIKVSFLSVTFSYLAIEEHFITMMNGVLDTRDLVYFIVCIMTFLLLARYCLIRWSKER